MTYKQTKSGLIVPIGTDCAKQDEPEPSDDITMDVESRPSNFTGISFWVVIRYKTHKFEDMLPADWPGLPKKEQRKHVSRVARALKHQLQPILAREDGELH